MTRLVVRPFCNRQTLARLTLAPWGAEFGPRTEMKGEGEWVRADFAHAHRQAIELPALSIHSIMGAMQKRRSNILLSFNFLASARRSGFWTEK